MVRSWVMESLHFQGCSNYVKVQVDSVHPDPPGPFMVPVCEVGEVVSLPISVGVLGVKPAVLKSPFVEELLHTCSFICSVLGGV